MDNIMNKPYRGVIDRYRDRLPVSSETAIISLQEGNTPLIRLVNIPKDLPGNIEIYVKFEGINPTGSFKDRGMTMAVTKAVEAGSQAIICASTGNTSAAAAAYAARAGITSFVIVPDGKIAMGKLVQAVMVGAVVIQINGNFDQGLDLVKAVAANYPITIVNSVNPYRLQGQKTASFEIIDFLGFTPDYHALPVGNAGNITSYWLGYQEYFNDNVTDKLPKMLGYQASGSAPFIEGSYVDYPETLATAIRIGHPQYWEKAQAAQQDSGGWFAGLSDEEILKAQYLLASQEGIFCEPASSASVAGVLRDIKSGKIPDHSRIVCTLTGHGLKDTDIIHHHQLSPLTPVQPNMESIEQVITKYLK